MLFSDTGVSLLSFRGLTQRRCSIYLKDTCKRQFQTLLSPYKTRFSNMGERHGLNFHSKVIIHKYLEHIFFIMSSVVQTVLFLKQSVKKQLFAIKRKRAYLYFTAFINYLISSAEEEAVKK